MSHVLSIDALHTSPIDCPSVATLRIIGLRALGLVVVVPKYTSPLLHRLLVVLRAKGSVCASVVDLHLRTAAAVSRVHILGDVGPGLRGGDGVALSARAIPGVHLNDGVRSQHCLTYALRTAEILTPPEAETKQPALTPE